MNRFNKLSEVAKYSSKRIDSSRVTLENFITTDNILPNKGGVVLATGLPPNCESMPSYKKNDILVGNIRPYLKKIWFATNSGGCSADVLVIEVNDAYDPKFVYYSIFRDEFFEHMMRGSKGTKMPRGDKNQILEFLIPNLELAYQTKIASVLSSLDSKIELNNRINAELEAMAKTIYDYWFVQFDFPFDFAQGKPDADGRPYKSSGGKMVWSDELKREVPEGWGVGKLGDIAELIRGVTYDSNDIRSQDESGVIPILRATNISGNVIDLDEMVYVSRENVSDVQILSRYDILITMSSGSKEHIGKNGFFYYETEVAFGAFCAKIKAKSEYRFYIYSYTQSDFMFSTIRNECLGTNINNLNGSLVKGFKIIIPPIELIKSFNEKVSSAFEKIGNNMIYNQHLSHLRDWLLPMLMNGQVRVG